MTDTKKSDDDLKKSEENATRKYLDGAKRIEVQKILLGHLKVHKKLNIDQMAKIHNIDPCIIENLIYSAVSDNLIDVELVNRDFILKNGSISKFSGRSGHFGPYHDDNKNNLIRDTSRRIDSYSDRLVFQLYSKVMMRLQKGAKNETQDVKGLTIDGLFDIVNSIKGLNFDIFMYILKLALVKGEIKKYSSDLYKIAKIPENNNVQDYFFEGDFPSFLRRAGGIRKYYNGVRRLNREKDEEGLGLEDIIYEIKALLIQIPHKDIPSIVQNIDQIMNRDEKPLLLQFAEVMWLVFFSPEAIYEKIITHHPNENILQKITEWLRDPKKDTFRGLKQGIHLSIRCPENISLTELADNIESNIFRLRQIFLEICAFGIN